MSVLGAESEPVNRAASPAVATAPEPLVNEALVEAQARIDGQAARQAALEEAARAEAARKEAERNAATEQAAEERRATEQATEDSAPAAPVAPADTTMYLSVPKLSIYDVPVVEGTTETALTAGAGHLPSSGYPWVEGSNTYIAGHRLGYPGTPAITSSTICPNSPRGTRSC
jgi:hypothetical protein